MYRVFLATLMALSLVFVTSCSDDEVCPVCPVPDQDTRYDGRLYVTSPYWFDSTGALFVIDTRTDSILDSIVYPRYYSIAAPSVSGDGKYLAVTISPPVFPYTQVYDATTLGPVGTVSGTQAVFTKNGRELLVASSSTFFRYSVPSLHLISSNSLDSGTVDGEIVYNQRTNAVFAICDLDTALNYPTELIMLDLDSLEILRRWEILTSSGEPYSLHAFDVHPTGQLAYFLASSKDGAEFVAYSLDSGKIMGTQPFFLYYGDIQVDPKGESVFVTDPGFVGEKFNPGTIFIFEALTGRYRGGISLLGYLPDELLSPPFDAWDLAITPDGNRLYTTTGNIFMRLGTVLSINTKTREIEKLIFPKIDHLFWGLVAGPKPNP